MSDLVLVDVADGVATLTLNRPHRLNAWTDRLGAAYRAALADADHDPDVRAVVVTGAGRGFCAGADVRALDALRDAGGYEAVGGSGQPAEAVAAGHRHHPALDPLQLGTPVVAAVNGPAAGLGFVVMLACDVRFVAADAKLTTTFTRLGLAAEHGSGWLLARAIGSARAADLLLSGRVVLGDEAAALGLANAALPAPEVLPAAQAYARQLAAGCSPAAMAAVKAQLLADLQRPFDASVADSVALLDRLSAGPDFAEGSRALAEGRPPRFGPRVG